MTPHSPPALEIKLHLFPIDCYIKVKKARTSNNSIKGTTSRTDSRKIDGLITSTSGNVQLHRFSRLSTAIPPRSIPNIYRARLSASNCSRLAFVAGEKLSHCSRKCIPFAPIRVSPSCGESWRVKTKKKEKTG